MIGGVIAGCVAAWALAGSVAHAATADESPARPMHEAGKHFREKAAEAAEKLSEASRKAAASMKEAAASMKEAVERGAEKAREAFRGGRKDDEQAGKPESEAERLPQLTDSPAAGSARPHIGKLGRHLGKGLHDLGGLLADVLGGGKFADAPGVPGQPGDPQCAKRFRAWCGWFEVTRPEEQLPVLPGDEESPLLPTLPAVGLMPLLPSVGQQLPATDATAYRAVTAPLSLHDLNRRAAVTGAADDIEAGFGSADQSTDEDFPGEKVPTDAPGQPATTAPNAGVAHGGHVDGSPMAITVATAAVAACGVTSTLRRSIPGVYRPGGQPGVTPD
ncbi:hypothetical protein [Thermocrispum sp.]|nr:hypothetical protein [Thermocrispum sp.]